MEFNTKLLLNLILIINSSVFGMDYLEKPENTGKINATNIKAKPNKIFRTKSYSKRLPQVEHTESQSYDSYVDELKEIDSYNTNDINHEGSNEKQTNNESVQVKTESRMHFTKIKPFKNKVDNAFIKNFTKASLQNVANKSSDINKMLADINTVLSNYTNNKIKLVATNNNTIEINNNEIIDNKNNCIKSIDHYNENNLSVNIDDLTADSFYESSDDYYSNTEVVQHYKNETTTINFDNIIKYMYNNLAININNNICKLKDLKRNITDTSKYFYYK